MENNLIKDNSLVQHRLNLFTEVSVNSQVQRMMVKAHFGEEEGKKRAENELWDLR